MPKIETPADGAVVDPDEAEVPDLRVATVSTVEAAANALREWILDGRLEPASRLREAEFAERLGIARHSFRAATQILIAEGLLVREPNRGVQVPVLDPDDLIDVFRLRTALEVEAARLVVASADVPEATEASVDALSALRPDAPWRDVVAADMAFHRSIIDAAGSERLARSYATVQSEILLCLAQLRPHYERPSQVALEHEELIAAIRSRDADRTEQLLRAHLAEAAENLTRAWRELTGMEVVV